MALSKVRAIFQKRPLLTNSIIYGSMCFTAELSQQMLNKRYFNKKNPPEPIDKGSLVRYFVVGSCINSNLLYFWYRWLDRSLPGTAVRVVVKKLLLDQFIMTPTITTAFYVSMSVMEGRKDLLAELKQKFIPTFQTSCCFWIPAQAINFLLVPPVARVVYVASCSFVWVNILCYIKRNELIGKEETIDG